MLGHPFILVAPDGEDNHAEAAGNATAEQHIAD